MSLGGDHQNIADAICAIEGYKLAEEIGEGSFKHSFKVISPGGDEYCLKLSKGNLSQARSDREIEAIRRCDHPGIAKLLSVGQFARASGDQLLYSVEEFVAGGSLEDHLKSGPISSDEARTIGRALAEALSETASLNLVHRDIKPANIMLREDGFPVLVDFGLVRVLDDSSVTPTWLGQGPGTPWFAAPEQLNNEKELIDWRADQFGLGATIAMSTLQLHPYAMAAGENPPAVIQRVVDRIGPSSALEQEAKSAGLEILVQMTQPWPVQRLRTPDLLVAGWN